MVLISGSSTEFNPLTENRSSDADVEVKGVTTGYRLSIVYSITHSSMVATSASAIQDWQQDLLVLLEMWKSTNESSPIKVPNLLAWTLEAGQHKELLSLSTLKIGDRQLAQVLSDLCLQRGIYVYLANATQIVHGIPDEVHDLDYIRYNQWLNKGYDYEDEEADTEMAEETSRSLCLTEIVKLDGNTFLGDVEIPFSTLIHDAEDFPFGADPFHEEGDGETVEHHFRGVVSDLGMCL